MSDEPLPNTAASQCSGRRVTPSALAGMLAATLLAGLMIACADAPTFGTNPRTRDPATRQVQDVVSLDSTSRRNTTLVSWSSEAEGPPAWLRSGRVWGLDPHCGDVSLLDSIPRVPLRIVPPWPRHALSDKGSHGAIFGAP